MEIYFVDIGKGTSNLILLGQNRAIVIDCGSNSFVLLQLMKSVHVQEVECMVVSHNHHDHVGGALNVLNAYEGRIRRICFLQDGQLEQTRFLRRIKEQIRNKIISGNQLLRLECDDTPRAIYPEDAQRRSLTIISPRYIDNIQAVQEGDQNSTSGILVLTVEDKQIVFAGDSSVRQWRRIRESLGAPLHCDILAVPHHGGVVWRSEQDLHWLYTEGVRPRCAIVSVATSNTDRHPRTEVIQELTSAGAVVVCTQITMRCCDDLETLRPGVIVPQFPGVSVRNLDRTGAGNSRNVACGGTMVAEWSNSQLTIRRLQDHQDAVDRMVGAAGCHPLCRR
jgi:beta-lactamase superfamily II metal-dependent hydrolase